MADSLYSKIMSGVKALALLYPAIYHLQQQGFTSEATYEIVKKYTGYNPDTGFNFSDLMKGWGAYGGITLAEKGLSFMKDLI